MTARDQFESSLSLAVASRSVPRGGVGGCGVWKVRAYGKAMLLHSADGVDVDAAELAGELHRRKRIDLMDDCDVHPWDPRPVRIFLSSSITSLYPPST